MGWDRKTFWGREGNRKGLIFSVLLKWLIVELKTLLSLGAVKLGVLRAFLKQEFGKCQISKGFTWTWKAFTKESLPWPGGSLCGTL